MLPLADARKITREEHEDACQAAHDITKTRQYDISMKLRKKVRCCLPLGSMLFCHCGQDLVDVGRGADRRHPRDW